MDSKYTRVAVGVVALVVAVVLLVVLSSGGGGDKTTKGVTTITIKNGKPVGGVAQLTYNEGEQVRFKVDSDVSDEIHMHGYDIAKDVEAGGQVTYNVPADIDGIFEVEIEDLGEQIAELRVNP